MYENWLLIVLFGVDELFLPTDVGAMESDVMPPMSPINNKSYCQPWPSNHEQVLYLRKTWRKLLVP